MATLTNTKIKDTYPALLKADDNGVIGITEKVITDGLGNASILSIGTQSASFSEDIEINGQTFGVGGGSVASNIAIGNSPLSSNTTGAWNIALGENALSANTIGTSNIALGTSSLASITNGSSNVAIGIAPLQYIDGNQNVSVGFRAGSNLFGGANKTAGSYNTYLGSLTYSGLADTNNEIVIGYGAVGNGSNTATYGNSSITDHYFDGNVRADFFYGDGSNLTNLPVGTIPTLDQVTGAGETSSVNVIINGADLGTIVNSSNTLFGDGALASFTTGSSNTAIGYQALTAVISGSGNTVIGSRALDNYTSGTANTAIGSEALGNGTTLSYNVAIGDDALFYINGSYNVALGHKAGEIRFGGGTKSAGDSNIYIGSNTVSAAADTDNEIVIGANATGNGSNSATYGDSNITKHIFTGGNVGVNKSPENFAQLEVKADTNGKAALLLDSNATTQDAYIQYEVGGSAGWEVGMKGSGSSYGYVFSYGDIGTASNERMRIDSSGNVGIGISPTAKLDILVGADQRLLFSTVSTDPFIGAVNAANSAYKPLNLNGSELKLMTGGSEKMRIDSSGSIHIGRQGGSLSTAGYSFVKSGNTAYAEFVHSNTGDGSANLYVSRANNGTAILFYRGDLSSTVGSISVTTTATAYNTSSDYRLKENVVEMTGALDRVDALKPSRFNFIADPEKTVDGFLAHEVQAIVPEAVTGEKDAVDEEGNPIYQGIDQSKIVPLLVGAIKELSAKVAALESQLNA